MKMGNQRGRSLKHTGLMRASITLGQGEGFELDTAESIIQVRLNCAALQKRLWSDAVEEKNG